MIFYECMHSTLQFVCLYVFTELGTRLNCGDNVTPLKLHPNPILTPRGRHLKYFSVSQYPYYVVAFCICHVVA